MSKLDAQYADEALAGCRNPAPPIDRAPLVRQRMIDLIYRRATMAGAVTRGDLHGGGFSDAEIERHFRPALRAAGVSALAIEG